MFNTNLANVDSVHSKLISPSFFKFVPGISSLSQLNLCCIATLTKQLNINISICSWTFNIPNFDAEVVRSYKKKKKRNSK